MSENPRVTDDLPSRADKIDVDRDRGLTIVFGDGRECFFANEDLRMQCPCAECRGLRANGDAAWPRSGAPTVVRVEAAELVGLWGITFAWSDGHGTGIYPFASLRSWCDGNS